MEQKNNNEPQPIDTTSAAIAANPVLPAALSVKDGNELIAKFMGGVKQIIPKGGLHGYKEGAELWMCVFSSNPDPLSYLSFNDEWDWIMPVVIKIEDYCKAHVTMYNKQCWIEFYGIHNDPCAFHNQGNNFILNVWLSIVSFIQWYNQQGVSKGSR